MRHLGLGATSHSGKNGLHMTVKLCENWSLQEGWSMLRRSSHAMSPLPSATPHFQRNDHTAPGPTEITIKLQAAFVQVFVLSLDLISKHFWTSACWKERPPAGSGLISGASKHQDRTPESQKLYEVIMFTGKSTHFHTFSAVQAIPVWQCGVWISCGCYEVPRVSTRPSCNLKFHCLSCISPGIEDDILAFPKHKLLANFICREPMVTLQELRPPEQLGRQHLLQLLGLRPIFPYILAHQMQSLLWEGIRFCQHYICELKPETLSRL